MKPLTGKFRRALLTWIGLIGLFIGIQLFANRNLAGGTPPPLAGPTLDGRANSGLAHPPKPALIYFWASWCGICRAMQGTIGDLAKDTPLVTVALQSGDAAEVRHYLEQQDFPVPVVLDADGAIGKSYGLRGVPAVFILGRDGAIHSSSAGYSTALGLRLRLWLAGW